MRNEIAAAALFLVQLMEKNDKFTPEQVECFGRRLVELLTKRFENHWFPDKPFKGQGYRCIRVNGNSRRDPTLESAACAAGLKYEDLSLPVELTLWVDPHEVCCRFGESKGSYCTLASFVSSEDKETNPEPKQPKNVIHQKPAASPSGQNRRRYHESSNRNRSWYTYDMGPTWYMPHFPPPFHRTTNNKWIHPGGFNADRFRHHWSTPRAALKV